MEEDLNNYKKVSKKIKSPSDIYNFDVLLQTKEFDKYQQILKISKLEIENTTDERNNKEDLYESTHAYKLDEEITFNKNKIYLIKLEYDRIDMTASARFEKGKKTFNLNNLECSIYVDSKLNECFLMGIEFRDVSDFEK